MLQEYKHDSTQGLQIEMPYIARQPIIIYSFFFVTEIIVVAALNKC